MPHKPFLLLAVALSFVVTPPSDAHANSDPWRLRLAPVFVDSSGHDPEIVGTGTGAWSLETESGIGYLFEFRRDRRARWDWGVQFFWFTGPQDGPRSTASGTASAPVTWTLADGAFTSASGDEVLFAQRLSDSDLNAWAADVYALRTVSADERGTLQFLLGIRNADFDNDTRAVVGIEGVGGTRIDASSNYSRMIGPLVGISLDRVWGKSRYELTLSQSFVTGDAELSAKQSDFTGAFVAESQDFLSVREFSQPESVTIPITDLNARWVYSLTRRVALAAGLFVSAWTDVSIPPGVSPEAGLDSTREASITFTGATVAIELRF